MCCRPCHQHEHPCQLLWHSRRRAPLWLVRVAPRDRIQPLTHWLTPCIRRSAGRAWSSGPPAIGVRRLTSAGRAGSRRHQGPKAWRWGRTPASGGHTTSYVFISTYCIQCRMSEMDIRCRMYMTYDIVGLYRIRHRMCIRCRMSTYDIVCQTYDIVCQTYDVVYLLEVAVSAVLKESDPCPQHRQMSGAFPTARTSFLASQQARQCQKHGLCGVLAP